MSEKERKQYINSVNLYQGTEFPYLVLHVINDQSYPRNPGFRVMHWHEDLQFIYVLHGKIQVKSLESSVEIQEGEAVFINKNVIHHVMKLEDCHYYSFVFPAHFLTFSPLSPAKKFVDDIVGNSQITLLHLSKEVDWCGEALELLQKLAELEEKQTETYPYEVLVLLSSIWLVLRKNMKLPTDRKNSIITTRTQTFLQYIEAHYREDVSMEKLAGSANVSKSECLRCFRESLQTTPYRYLMEYRLAKAGELLQSTDQLIHEIAADVGFHQLSYFGKCFKEKTGYSPRMYRKMYRQK